VNFKPVLTQYQSGSFRVWDDPRDDVEYVIGADIAEGKKRDRSALQRRGVPAYSDQRVDYSAAIVLELVTGQHVATWHGYVPPEEFAAILAAVGLHYNYAMLVPELTGPGLAVVTKLIETLHYDNLYRSTMLNVLDLDPLLPKFGFQTNRSTRPLLMAHIGEALAEGLYTRDERLIGELRTMEFDDQGIERARGKNHDDCVLALGLALRGRALALPILPRYRADKKAPDRAYEARVWDKVKRKSEERQHGMDRHRNPRAGLWSRRSFGVPVR